MHICLFVLCPLCSSFGEAMQSGKHTYYKKNKLNEEKPGT